MPNICDFDIKIRGKASNVRKFYNYLSCYYDYNNIEEPIVYYTDSCGNKIPSEHHIGYRVFECNHDNIPNNDNVVIINGYGNCAWSVYSCMLDGNFSYLHDNIQQNELGYAISLDKACKLLDCEVEIFSCEMGMGFSEHYYINNNGQMVVEEDTSYQTLWLDDYECYDDILRQVKDNDLVLPKGFNAQKFHKLVEDGNSCYEYCDFFDRNGFWKWRYLEHEEL